MATSSPAPLRRSRLAIAIPFVAAAAALAVLLPLRGGKEPPPPAARRPDLVLVVWDTCRGDRVGVNGYPRPTTPLLDALAADGVVYRRCFTPAPWTPPAHGSLFTGLLPRRHGLVEGMGERLLPGIPTLASTLRDAGYETVCVSANPLVSGVTGLDAGFETVLPSFRTGEGGVTGEEAVANVRRWLHARRRAPLPRRPFLLFVNLMDCHLPYVHDPEGVEAVHGKEAVEPTRHAAAAVTDHEARLHLMGVGLLHPDLVAQLSRAYDGAVRRNDRNTGRILDLLRAEGLPEDALVAVTSDHGENLGEHGEMDHAFSVHDTVIRVPLVVRRAGRFDGGRVVEGAVALQDLYPTLLEAAGVAVPAVCGADARLLGERAEEGRVVVSEYGPMPRSLVEAARAMPGAPPETLARFRWRYRAARTWSPVTGGRTLLFTEREEADGSWSPVSEALYDPAADPGEDRNLLGTGESPAERAAAERLRAAAGR